MPTIKHTMCYTIIGLPLSNSKDVEDTDLVCLHFRSTQLLSFVALFSPNKSVSSSITIRSETITPFGTWRVWFPILPVKEFSSISKRKPKHHKTW